MWPTLLLFTTVISVVFAAPSNDIQTNAISNSNSTKVVDKCSRMYICPPNFLRINQNCYYFSTEAVQWKAAFDDCIERKGTLAMIRNVNQDNNVKSLLQKVPLARDERWIGGMYDWAKMNWKWGKNAKEIKYLGFDPSVPHEKEKLQWMCITLDPKLEYRWNARSCFEKKHYICQTRITKIPRAERKKIMRKFNADKNNKLNEVLAPNLPEDNLQDLKTNKAYIPNAAYALRNNTVTDKQAEKKKNQRKKRKNKKKHKCPVYVNGKKYDVPMTKYGRRKRLYRKSEVNDTSIENIKSRIYYSLPPKSPLHPRILTEELIF